MKTAPNYTPILPPDLMSEFMNQQIAYAVAVCEASKEFLAQTGRPIRIFDAPLDREVIALSLEPFLGSVPAAT